MPIISLNQTAVGMQRLDRGLWLMGIKSTQSFDDESAYGEKRLDTQG